MSDINSQQQWSRRTWFCTVLLALIACALQIDGQRRLRHRRNPSTAPAGSNSGSGPCGVMPILANKPSPNWDSNWSCSPQGDATATSPSDPALNKLKNRIDLGNFVPVDFCALQALPFPKPLPKKRSSWSQSQRAQVSVNEGIPIAVEGFIALAPIPSSSQMEGAREEGPESCNCHNDVQKFHDFHVWLLGSPNDTRNHAVVVEVTPPVRDKHPQWVTIHDKLTEIATKKERVRISGWLMLDQEHPEQINKTRATLWEIHPIIKIQVQQTDGSWVEL